MVSAAESSIAARPTSVRIAPARAVGMLAGLASPCTVPRRCAACSASRTCPPRPAAPRIFRIDGPVVGPRKIDLLGRDIPVEQRVVTLPDGAHPAPAQDLLQPIPTGDHPSLLTSHAENITNATQPRDRGDAQPA